MSESVVSKISNFIHTSVRAIGSIRRHALWLTVFAILALFRV